MTGYKVKFCEGLCSIYNWMNIVSNDILYILKPRPEEFEYLAKHDDKSLR